MYAGGWGGGYNIFFCLFFFFVIWELNWITKESLNLSCIRFQLEPQHYKTDKMIVRAAKTRISLGIRPVWSEFSPCAQFLANDRRFLHADSEDPGQTGRMPRLIWVFAGRKGHFFDFVVLRLIFKLIKNGLIVRISNYIWQITAQLFLLVGSNKYVKN